MMLAAPVVGVGGGVVLAGAGLGGAMSLCRYVAMSLWSCDQSDNGFFRPSLELDSSCVATEIALGAVFAPLGGQLTGRLARRVAVACGFGALEGSTSTVAHMTFVEEDQAFDASDALVGAGIGCATGGVLSGAGRAMRRSASETRDASRLVGGGSGSWVEDALRPPRYIAGSTQSAPGSCVSMCGEILSGGRLLEAELLDELGEFSTPALLRGQLGDGWQTGFFDSGAQAISQAQSGTLGAVLQSPGDARHMVVITPRGNGIFEVLDPYDGSIYPVDSDWIARFVSEGIWFVG